jgi:putative GTP pyrophosphokinase
VSILDDFDSQEPTLARLSSKLETLLNEILRASNIRIHSITTRVKTRNSLEKKIAKSAAKYDSIGQITDCCGARVIAYFEDDVDKIASIVVHEFEIDTLNSIDKRRREDVATFGYASVHWVASMKPSRTDLAEYHPFEGLKFEIQIRSILQHSWAEIEHDLQYKSEIEIPREIRRRFARLAGLIELADAEFTGIRDQVASYRRRVESDVKTAPNTVLVDRDSLAELAEQSELVSKLDAEMAELLDASPGGTTNVDRSAAFNRLGLSSIGSVESALAANAPRLARFYKAFITRSDPAAHPRGKTLFRGISLFYLSYVLMAQLGSEAEIVRVLDDIGFASMPGGLEWVAQLILGAYADSGAPTA